MAPDDPQPFNVPFSWVGYDELPIVYANQFLIQYQPGESAFVIGVGQSTLPPLIGEGEDLAEQISQIDFVAIRPLSRIALTEDKMRELIAVLSASLAKAESVKQMIDPRGGDT